MKYIDADKLIAEIDRRIEETKSMKPSFDQFWAGQISAFKGVKTIITSRYILETHAMWECIAALGVKPFKDGDQWCFLYGDNIQEGICGFGETIFKAAWDFYTNIKTEVARKEDEK